MRSFSEQEFEDLLKVGRKLEELIDHASGELDIAEQEIIGADEVQVWARATLNDAKSMTRVLNEALLSHKE